MLIRKQHITSKHIGQEHDFRGPDDVFEPAALSSKHGARHVFEWNDMLLVICYLCKSLAAAAVAVASVECHLINWLGAQFAQKPVQLLDSKQAGISWM